MSFIDYANDLIQEGYNPIPLKSNKAPNLMTGHGFLYNPIDKVEQRFSSCDKIGIVCGQVSGGFYCIDFDKHQGQDIEPIFESFFENEAIQYLVQQDQLIFYKTPSGGYHAYFRYNETIPGTVFSKWIDNKTMIELRGNGQYVACYPSEGYQYVAGNELLKLQYIEEKAIIDFLFNLCVSYTKDPDFKGIDLKDKSERKWPEKWDDKKIDGKFNNESAEIVKKLLEKKGWKLAEKRKHDGVEYWVRPGKDVEEGISATFGVKFNMFYCWTSNASPFLEKTAYNPFQIYTLLKFNGDWKAAKDSLRPPKPKTEAPSDSFPIDVFPEQIQDYILELNRTLNFHIDFSSAAAMFTVSTINGNKYKLRVKNGWDAQTIFWFACVGYPGTIKTHPVKTFIRPLNNIDIASKQLYDAEMSHYDPNAKGKGAMPKPKFRQILISDYTVEALHSIHDINKRGIGLYKDELKGFLNDMNKYRKGSDEEFWLESFNNGSYIVNRVTKDPILVKNICINIIGTIQHDVLSKVASDYKGNGLIDRFLFTASESTVYELTNQEIDNFHEDLWNELIKKCNRYFDYIDSQDTEILDMDAETFSIYQEIDRKYVSMQNSEDYTQEIKNYLSKMKTYVPRFALLLAIMESVCDETLPEVKKIHMINAGRIADYFINTAKSTLSFNEHQSEINELVSTMKSLTRDEKIIKLHQKGIKISEIARFFSLTRQSVSKKVNRV